MARPNPKLKWYKFDPEAYLNGVKCLTFEEIGAYTILFNEAYARDGHLPYDIPFLQTVLHHCRPEKAKRLVGALISKGKLHDIDGILHSYRVDSELIAARYRMDKSEIANEKRWKNNGDGVSKHSAVGGHNHNHNHNHNQNKKEGKKESPEQDFSRFWSAYPRHVGKPAAAKAFAKAIGKTSIDEILAALQWQSGSWRDPQFIPHPATWLNQERWADERTLPLNGGNGHGNGRHETFAERSARLIDAARTIEAERAARRADRSD